MKKGTGIVSDQPIIDISNLPKADVLATLFNTAEAPHTMGALQFQEGPYIMDRKWAQELVELGNVTTPDYGGISLPGRSKLYFDYLYGRCLKLELTNDTFDPWAFDRVNGPGSAQQAIDRLRRTGEINVTPDCDARTWLQEVTDKAILRFDKGDLYGAAAQFIIGTARHPNTKHIADQETIGPALVLAFRGGRDHLRNVMMSFQV